MPAIGIGLVVGRAKGREDAAVAELPLLNLVVVALDIRSQSVEVFEQTRLDGVRPRLVGIGVRVDAASLEQVVLDRRERERLDVPGRLLPVGRLARVERRELDRKAFPIRACEDRLRCLRQLVEPRERCSKRDRGTPVRSPPSANWVPKTRPSRAAKTGTPIATSRKLLIPVSWPLWPS